MAPLSSPIKPGIKTRVVLRLANPTQFPTSIKFLPFAWVPLKKSDDKVPSPDDLKIISSPESLTTATTILTSQGQGMNPNESSTDPQNSLTSLNPSLNGSSQMMKEIHVLPIRNEEFHINVRLDPPDSEVVLPPRDETSDFDDFADTPDFNDDVSLVPWRKANKAAVYLDVIMDNDAKEEDEPILGLTIEYDYVNTILALENRSSQGPQKVRLQAHLLIALNKTPQ